MAGDGFTSRLLAGLAEHYAANSVGTWRDTGIYTSGETGIVIRAVPQAPDRIITLAAYPVDAGYVGMSDQTIGVQHRLRGTTDPRDCDDLADAIFDLMDSRGHLELSTGVHIVQAIRRSYTSLGQDANKRWERSENYYIDVMRPTAHRTD